MWHKIDFWNKVDNHMTMYGCIFFTGVVVTTQNPENRGRRRVQKTGLLFLIVKKLRNTNRKRDNDYHQRRY